MEIEKGLRVPLRGERIIGIDPLMKPLADPTWRKRLNLFTGRALSEAALNAEQAGRNGRMAALGQMLSAGVITGLEVTLDKSTNVFNISGGFGVAATGEDVVVPYSTRIAAENIRVMATAALLAGLPQEEEPHVDTATGPLRARILGATLGKLKEDSIALPAAGILVLQPTISEVLGRPPQAGDEQATSLEFSTSSCELDDSAYAFEDWQLADGCRLIYYAWPTEWLPIPTPGARLRNRLAYGIFRREEELSEGEFMPWELVGVPIGLVGLKAGMPDFVDRHSVVRAGGMPKRHTSVFGRGNPFLWQARTEQFIEQLADEDARADLDTIEKIAAEFRYLPPAGLLPKEAFNLVKKQSLFFHDSYTTHAVPVPVEQLDIVLEGSASLAPFDSFTADQARVLVPVPQAFYDPYLLIEAKPDPLFQKEQTEAEGVKEEKLQRRSELRKKAGTLIQAMRGQAAPVEFEDKEEPKTPGMASKEEAYGTHVKDAAAGTLEADEVVNLVALFSASTRAKYTEEIVKEGVEGFIENLDLRIRKADDAIDTGFLRAQTDIYRLRQLVLDATDASRLATSPALATIAQGESSTATRDDISRFIKENKGKTIPTSTKETTPAGAPTGGFTMMNAPLTLAFLPVTISPAATVKAEAEARLKVEAAKVAEPAVFYKMMDTPSKVYDAAPLTGDRPDYKTITTAERLRDPKSEEARNYTLATRAEIVKNLSDLDLDFDNVEIAGVPPEGDNKRTTFGNSKNRLSEILAKIQRNEYDPIGTQIDEAQLFQNGVRHIDLTVSTLRSAEGQIKLNRKLLEASRKALENLQKSAASLDRRMKELGDELAEVRHDLSVGAALLKEEIARVKAINDRRTAVLKEHVKFVAYHRPRFAANVRSAPSHYINPGFAPGSFPPCSDEHDDAPQELRDLLDLFREAPASWFKELFDSIDKLHRLEMMEEALRRARERVAKPIVTKTYTVQAKTKLGLAVATSYESQRQVMVSVKEERTGAMRDALIFENWREARDHARKVLSVEDLMDSGHGRSDAARDAIREMNDIFRIAACLHDRLDNVLPIIRLQWAERLSQFDAVTPLRVLASLPRWDDIEYLDRVEMQTFVDWLFGRVDEKIPAAYSLINTLVRVCILLASHSPVNQIIAGVVLQPAPLRFGGLVLINVDHTRVFRGMAVQFKDAAGVMAQAVVDDLAVGKASVRITKTYKEEIVLSAGSPAEFISSKYTAQIMQ